MRAPASGTRKFGAFSPTGLPSIGRFKCYGVDVQPWELVRRLCASRGRDTVVQYAACSNSGSLRGLERVQFNSDYSVEDGASLFVFSQVRYVATVNVDNCDVSEILLTNAMAQFHGLFGISTPLLVSRIHQPCPDPRVGTKQNFCRWNGKVHPTQKSGSFRTWAYFPVHSSSAQDLVTPPFNVLELAEGFSPLG